MKSQYKAKRVLLGPGKGFLFKDKAISLEIPDHGVMQGKWKIIPTIPPKVSSQEA